MQNKMKILLWLTFILAFLTTLFKITFSLSCLRPSGPCNRPVCCNVGSNGYPIRNRAYDSSSKSYTIELELVHGACPDVCQNKCPKQLGEPCGGIWGTEGTCDPYWLTCHGSTDNEPGRCIRKKKIGHQKTKEMQNFVPVCEDMKDEKVCKCLDSKLTEAANKDMPHHQKWCFLHQIESHEDPKSNCYEDVTWSKTNGRFWSYLAYQAENPSPIGDRKVIEIKEQGLCEDFGQDTIKTLEECKFAAETIGKIFPCPSELCIPIRMGRLPNGCVTYRNKAYFNDLHTEKAYFIRKRTRSKRSSKRRQKTTRKRKAGNNRKNYPQLPSICYEKKEKETCVKEADYGCDDKNPCCDGLSCKIVQGHSQWLKVPKCIKDSSEQEKCLEEGEFLCDDVNTCCDGLYCCNKENKCKRKDDSDEKCIFEDKEYKLGESRRHRCNTCRCMKGGQWACTLKGCPRPGICKNHEEHCGFQPTNPPKNHGKCCGGLMCKYKGVGGAGKCVKDDDDDEGSGSGDSSEPGANSEPSKESNSQQETEYTDPTYVVMNGYECTKKVLNKRKRPLLFLRMAKAKEICTKMSTCMGIMKHDCSRRLTRMYLCESGEDDLKRTKQKPSCVSMKVPEKRCPDICTADYDPVCGTDGKTYSNICRFTTHKCETKNQNLKVDYEGACKATYDNGQGSGGQGGRQDDSKEGGYETPNKEHKGGWSYYEG